MMRRPALAAAALILGVATSACAADQDWSTYFGDHTGQRHSPLAQINAGNVTSLALAWVYHATLPPESDQFLKPAIKSMPVEKNGMLFFSMPNHVWAIDA